MRVTPIRGLFAGLWLLLSLSSAVSRGSETVEPRSSASPLTDAIRVLEKVPSGRAILERACARFGEAAPAGLVRIFRWGNVSRTDAVLTRHFNPGTRTEVRERIVTVFLKRNQGLEELVLDLAHELTHAVGEPEWDPYDPSLTAGRYIRASIEGPGGEVDAMVSECRVSLELSARYGTSSKRCSRYRSARSRGGVDRQKVRNDFYRVGAWKAQLQRELGAEFSGFPDLSGASPLLFSSTGNAPYPLALLREFHEISGIACDNSRRRLEVLATGRTPASLSEANRQALSLFLARRCSAQGTGVAVFSSHK